MTSTRKLESGIATGIYILVVFVILVPSITRNVFDLQRMYGGTFARYHQVFDYYIHLLLPLLAHVTIVYAVFLFLHLLVVPRFLEQRRWLPGILLGVAALGIMFLVIMVANSYQYGYLLGMYDTVRGAHMHFAKSAFILTLFYTLIYVTYYAGRHLYLHYLYPHMNSSEQAGRIAKDGAILAGIWLVLLLFAGITGVSRFVFLLLLFLGPLSIVVFFISLYRVFPQYMTVHRNKKILWRDIALVVLGTAVPVLFALAIGTRVHVGEFIAFVCTLLPVTSLTLLFAWWTYTERQAGANTVLNLRKALGQSTADLDFLRAQINPHFLFNALNTLYGTALQENAGNTSEGIQKLGDMMRFMLHENQLEKIPLSKEIAYLRNYIALQRLRTQASPDIQIVVNIDEGRCEHDIAPMLLIPFVENAFKHGISLRNPSSITVSLCCDEEKLYFDVYNTVHARPEPENGPEREGIGLNNVKQRLMLIYPDRHELGIRQTASGFFVHLTISITN